MNNETQDNGEVKQKLQETNCGNTMQQSLAKHEANNIITT